MRINQRYWEIESAGWAIDQSPECVTLNPYDTGAALQLSCHLKRSGPVTDSDLSGFARPILEPQGLQPEAVQCGSFSGLYCSFVNAEPRFWRHWFLAHGPISLYVTYNTGLEDRDAHTAVVDWMLSSLKAMGLNAPSRL